MNFKKIIVIIIFFYISLFSYANSEIIQKETVDLDGDGVKETIFLKSELTDVGIIAFIEVIRNKKNIFIPKKKYGNIGMGPGFRVMGNEIYVPIGRMHLKTNTIEATTYKYDAELDMIIENRLITVEVPGGTSKNKLYELLSQKKGINLTAIQTARKAIFYIKSGNLGRFKYLEKIPEYKYFAEMLNKYPYETEIFFEYNYLKNTKTGYMEEDFSRPPIGVRGIRYEFSSGDTWSIYFSKNGKKIIMFFTDR